MADTATTSDSVTVARTYFTAWKEKDFDTLRSVLADDATFQGPLATLKGADDCVAGLKGMSQILEGIDVKHVFDDGPDVLTWFDLRTSVASPAPTANWMHIKDGSIRAIRVTFDPREIVAAG